jgi:GH15 family glucan-1,4-alpha-glucosidase
MHANTDAHHPASDGHPNAHAYPAIADHGLIGDLQTAALVSTDATIDWFCCPRFDSPSLFASLLDLPGGGSFEATPVNLRHRTKQMYFPDSAVLITRFMSEAGVAEVVDFMPVTSPEIPTRRHRIVRMLRGVRGAITFKLTCAPRFDYARQQHQVELTPEGAVFIGPDLQLTVHGMPGSDTDGIDLFSTVEVNAGDLYGIVLESDSHESPRAVSRAEVWDLFVATVRFWRDWLRGSKYRGRWREMVERSAITLKLMTYAPTGALIAAPTAALPERIGGQRNWDYRYTWVRDASFSIAALIGIGMLDEARAFSAWLRQRVEEHAGNGGGPLKIMYRVDGTSDLEEHLLEHMEGYRGSRPVRIGNGAAEQLQLDIYGEALNATYLAESAMPSMTHAGWQALTSMVNWLCENWDQPEEGIWETRGGRQNFVYGRLMAWVALDRAVRLAAETGRPAAIERWTHTRDAIYCQTMDMGWNPQLRSFVQYHGASVLDASLLMTPLTGFATAIDPLWLATLDAIEGQLVSDSLVYRYNPSASPDGLPGEEGTFTICSFWYVDALARSGRLDKARYAFEKMLTYANHLGLYAEEIDPCGMQLGNFPQAFSHLALISSAVSLDKML